MLPQLGLLKKVPCPFLPDCPRTTCIFSHDPKLIKRLPQPTSAAATTTTTTTSKQEILNKRQRSNNDSLTTQDRINNIIKKQKTSLPELSHNNNNNNTKSDKTLNRIAHKPKFAGPPTIKANIASHTALKIRQTISNKLFEQYIRIYPIDIHGNEVATKNTENEECKILEKTTNTAGYKQQAMSIIMQLKKKEPVLEIIASSSSDSMSQHKNNSNPSIHSSLSTSSASSLSLFSNETKKLDYKKIEELILTVDQLKEMGYPLISDFNNSNNNSNNNKNQDDNKNKHINNKPSPLSTTTITNQHKCDRCNRYYTIKSILNTNEMKACQYHFGKLRVVQSFGDKQRTYTCCNDPIGSPGCQQGPHVFKEENIQSLHHHIPFMQTKPSNQDKNKKEKLLALDCEMGYTTIGMELIRLTVINDKMETIIDEKVLPSHMIIDLNTRYSGITTLGGVEHNLSSIQQLLFQYMDENTILLGHGLENDLKALRIIHPKIIDTAHLYPHPNGLPYRYGLRMLSTKYLSKFIQDSSAGHDSYEDSKTCLELLYHYLEDS
ncbi:unnamed protein product [Cunninghamella blakesleeana]